MASEDREAGQAARGDRLLRRATAGLVLGVAALGFVVSFEAISEFAVTTGAFPSSLGWCAPLLVDSFTAAATLVILSRARAGLRAGYAWSLVAMSTAVSLALNVAHAPERLDARLVAALPSLAQLAAVELVMSEARRALAPAAAQGDASCADARASGDTRARVRALLDEEQVTGQRLTGTPLAAAVGLKPRRAQELLRELRAEVVPGGDQLER